LEKFRARIHEDSWRVKIGNEVAGIELVRLLRLSRRAETNLGKGGALLERTLRECLHTFFSVSISMMSSGQKLCRNRGVQLSAMWVLRQMGKYRTFAGSRTLAIRLASLILQPSHLQHYKRLKRSPKTRDIERDQYATIVGDLQVIEITMLTGKAKASACGEASLSKRCK
jgi:hypothetical protein